MPAITLAQHLYGHALPSGVERFKLSVREFQHFCDRRGLPCDPDIMFGGRIWAFVPQFEGVPEHYVAEWLGLTLIWVPGGEHKCLVVAQEDANIGDSIEDLRQDLMGMRVFLPDRAFAEMVAAEVQDGVDAGARTYQRALQLVPLPHMKSDGRPVLTVREIMDLVGAAATARRVQYLKEIKGMD